MSAPKNNLYLPGISEYKDSSGGLTMRLPSPNCPKMPSTPGSRSRKPANQQVFFPADEAADEPATIPITKEDMKGNKLLLFCNFLGVVTACAGVSSSLLHLYILLFEGDNWVYNDWLSHVSIAASHLYLAVFGAIIVLVERENPKILKNFAFLETWVGRGLFHIMCALWLYITTIHISSNHWLKVQPVSVPLPEGEMGESFQFPVDLDAPEEPEESISVRSARLFTDSVFETTRMTTGWLLLACGATYLFMGACFIGYFRDVQMIKIRDRKQILMQSERLKQHKKDLELLIEATDKKLVNV